MVISRAKKKGNASNSTKLPLRNREDTMTVTIRGSWTPSNTKIQVRFDFFRLNTSEQPGDAKPNKKPPQTYPNVVPSAPPSAETPPAFLDPLTGKWVNSNLFTLTLERLMTDPVVTPSGTTYERSSISRYLTTVSADPVTGEPLRREDLRDNTTLREAIQQWKHNNPQHDWILTSNIVVKYMMLFQSDWRDCWHLISSLLFFLTPFKFSRGDHTKYRKFGESIS